MHSREPNAYIPSDSRRDRYRPQTSSICAFAETRHSAYHMPDFCLDNMDPADTHECVRSRLRQLYPLLPDSSNACVPVQVDSTGTKHCLDSRGQRQGFVVTPPACIVGSTQETETTIEDLLNGSDVCGTCAPAALGPGSALSVKYLMQTKLLASIADDKFASGLDRARTIVKFVWGGNNNALPVGGYRKMVDKILMPELKTYVAEHSARELSAPPRVLVALTARDIYMGFDDNPSMYDYTVTAAARNTFYAAKSNSVWLLNVQSWPTLQDFPSGQWSLGTVLDDRFDGKNLSTIMCEIFSTFCDDALSGAADWANLQNFYRSAVVLAR